jgi:hypothetical protein
VDPNTSTASCGLAASDGDVIPLVAAGVSDCPFCATLPAQAIAPASPARMKLGGCWRVQDYVDGLHA